jgi:hypothetical protein
MKETFLESNVANRTSVRPFHFLNAPYLIVTHLKTAPMSSVSYTAPINSPGSNNIAKAIEFNIFELIIFLA